MKTIRLKLPDIFLLLLPLCVVLLGAGCKKVEEPNYDPTSIIGKWEWIYSLGGFAGTTYPQKGQNVIIEFTKDSISVLTVNGEIKGNSKFSVSGDTLKSVTYTLKPETYVRIFEISGDTLAIYDYSTILYANCYKRIE
jgi:hypothetical protein